MVKAESQHRKIWLPLFCDPDSGISTGGKDDCDHDYSETSRKEVYSKRTCSWTCRLCGMVRTYRIRDRDEMVALGLVKPRPASPINRQ